MGTASSGTFSPDRDSSCCTRAPWPSSASDPCFILKDTVCKMSHRETWWSGSYLMLNTLLWWTPVSRLSCLGDMLPASLALAFISRTNLTEVRRWVRSTRYYVLLWIRCLPNIFWVMNHICPTGGPAQKTWKHHQVKRNWWSMVMRRTCQQKYFRKN